MGYYRDPDDFCEMHPDVVIFATSILSTEATISAFPIAAPPQDTLVADVLSVKQFPKQLFLQRLPKDFDILCLHPMFGPDSEGRSWKDLPLVYDKVRVGDDADRRDVERLLASSRRRCRMVEMSCRARRAGGVEPVHHAHGGADARDDGARRPRSTPGVRESLLSLRDNTYSDSFDLYYGLFMYNKSATRNSRGSSSRSAR